MEPTANKKSPFNTSKSFLGLILMIVLLTSIIPGIINYIHDFVEIYKNSINHTKEKLNLLNNEANLFIENYFNNAKNIAEILGVYITKKDNESTEEKIEYIQKLLWNNPFHHIFIVDQNGNVVISPPFQGIDHKKGKIEFDFSKVNKTMITNFHFWKEGDHLHPLIISPLKNNEFLIIEVNLDSIHKFFIESDKKNDRQLKIKNYFIDRDFFSLSVFKDQVEYNIIKEHEIFKKVNLNQMNQGSFCDSVYNHNRERMYACILKMDNYDYYIVSEISTSEIFDFLKVQLIITSIIFSFLIIIIIFLIYKFIKMEVYNDFIS